MGEKRNGGDRLLAPNAVLVRLAIEEIWNQGNLDVADTLFGDEYANGGGIVPDLVHGPEAIKIAAALHHMAYPRLHVTIERLISEGPIVAFQWLAIEHGPPLADLVVAGPQPTLRGMTFCRMVSGKIVESWTNWDHASDFERLIRSVDRGPKDSPLQPPDGHGLH